MKLPEEEAVEPNKDWKTHRNVKSPTSPADNRYVEPNKDWKTYRNGEGDRSGRKIEQIYAVDNDYIIYFTDHEYSEDHAGRELFYETDPALKKEGLGKVDTELAGINRLLDTNQRIGSTEYKFNVSTLELAAGALRMFFCKEETEAQEILKSLHAKLQAKEEVQRRLMYQLGTLVIAAVPWVLYLFFHGSAYVPRWWNPWILAAALAMAGGLFSVCATIGSLEVNVNLKHWDLFFSGVTRAVVALLAGVGLLLAMRSKIFAGITYDGGLPNSGDPLKTAEMFFCFVAGFSEYLVPNILSKAADGKSGKGKTGNRKS